MLLSITVVMAYGIGAFITAKRVYFLRTFSNLLALNTLEEKGRLDYSGKTYFYGSVETLKERLNNNRAIYTVSAAVFWFVLAIGLFSYKTYTYGSKPIKKMFTSTEAKARNAVEIELDTRKRNAELESIVKELTK